MLNLPIAEQFIPWTIIFVACSFIIATYYIRKVTFSHITLPSISRAILMSVIYWLSVALYNHSYGIGGLLSEKYNWTLFMTAMMMGGNIVSYLKKEWINCNVTCHFLNGSALIIASISCSLLAFIRVIICNKLVMR